MTGRVVAAAPHPFPKSTFSPPFSTVVVPSHYFPLPLHWARSVTSVCSPPMSPPGSEAPNVCRACRRMIWYPIRSLRAGGTGKIEGRGQHKKKKKEKKDNIKKGKIHQELNETYNVAGSFDNHLSMQLEAPKSSHRK